MRSAMAPCGMIVLVCPEPLPFRQRLARSVRMMKKASPTYFVPALEKGLDILEALAVAPVPQSLADLARGLNRTSSELFRMIDSLEKRSYIARDPVSGGYHLTLRLYELAHTHSPVDQLLRASAIPMRELSDSLRESCHLSVLSGSQLTVVAQAESPDPVRLSIEVGYRAQPLNTTSGRVLIAFLEWEEQQRFLSEDAVYSKMSAGERDTLRAELTKIRKSGFHLAESRRRTGVDVSCVVGNPAIGILAVLGVPILAGGANAGQERKLVPVIRKHAGAITAALGLLHGRHAAAIAARNGKQQSDVY
jgi:DNA-binding IclR family transcriptional regulator